LSDDRKFVFIAVFLQNCCRCADVSNKRDYNKKRFVLLQFYFTSIRSCAYGFVLDVISEACVFKYLASRYIAQAVVLCHRYSVSMHDGLAIDSV